MRSSARISAADILVLLMPSVFIKTYGCQMNVRDSEQVARDLASRGYDLVEREEDADVVLLNTCSVRDMAEQKAIGKMQTLEGRKKQRQHQVIGFLGCMAQSRGRLDPRRIARRRSRHRHAKISRNGPPRRRALPPAPGKSRRNRARIVDVAEETGSQNTIRDHLLAPQPGHRFRLDHAGLQHALHLLHRPEHARRGTVPAHRGDRRRSRVARAPGRQGSHAARPDRQSLRPPRIPRRGRAARPSRNSCTPSAPCPGLERRPLHLAASDRLQGRPRRLLPRTAESLRARPSAAAIGQRPHPQGDAPRLHRAPVICA